QCRCKPGAGTGECRPGRQHRCRREARVASGVAARQARSRVAVVPAVAAAGGPGLVAGALADRPGGKRNRRRGRASPASRRTPGAGLILPWCFAETTIAAFVRVTATLRGAYGGVA